MIEVPSGIYPVTGVLCAFRGNMSVASWDCSGVGRGERLRGKPVTVQQYVSSRRVRSNHWSIGTVELSENFD